MRACRLHVDSGFFISWFVKIAILHSSDELQSSKGTGENVVIQARTQIEVLWDKGLTEVSVEFVREPGMNLSEISHGTNLH